MTRLQTTSWSYRSPEAAEGERLGHQTEMLEPRREAAAWTGSGVPCTTALAAARFNKSPNRKPAFSKNTRNIGNCLNLTLMKPV